MSAEIRLTKIDSTTSPVRMGGTMAQGKDMLTEKLSKTTTDVLLLDVPVEKTSPDGKKEETVLFQFGDNTEEKNQRVKQINEEVSKFKAGDERARGKVIELLNPMINSYTRRKVSDHSVTDHKDVAQEVLLTVNESLPKYNPKNNFLAYVFTIASRKVIDNHRDQKRELSNPTDQIPEGAEVFGANTDRKSVEEQIVQKTEVEQVKKIAEENLTVEERTILRMRVVDGMKAKEVGEVLDIEPGTVRVVQHRALNKLREELINGETPKKKVKRATKVSKTQETKASEKKPKKKPERKPLKEDVLDKKQPKYSEPLESRDKELGHKEVAEKLDTPSGTVSSDMSAWWKEYLARDDDELEL